MCKYIGCLPFVRIIRLGRALINGKGFSKITKPTERNGAYHLQFDFPSLFSADERLETGKFCPQFSEKAMQILLTFVKRFYRQQFPLVVSLIASGSTFGDP